MVLSLDWGTSAAEGTTVRPLLNHESHHSKKLHLSVLGLSPHFSCLGHIAHFRLMLEATCHLVLHGLRCASLFSNPLCVNLHLVPMETLLHLNQLSASTFRVTSL